MTAFSGGGAPGYWSVRPPGDWELAHGQHGYWRCSMGSTSADERLASAWMMKERGRDPVAQLSSDSIRPFGQMASEIKSLGPSAQTMGSVPSGDAHGREAGS